jgi:integrase
MWNGSRRCETLAYPATPQGIQAASGVRTTVVQLAKLGMLTDQKYAELFPSSSYIAENAIPTFGEYAQDWLNSKEIQAGTRRNYKRSLNQHWMPSLAHVPLNKITSMALRKIAADTKWASSSAKRIAMSHAGAVFKTAVFDDLIPRNPMASVELPARVKKVIDPFERTEAERIVDHLYAELTGTMKVYAAYFEFAFFSGMRPGEIYALRWDEVDIDKRLAHVCRIVVDGGIAERTKTGNSRMVMLNSRALHALAAARAVQTERAHQRRMFPDSPYVFPPTKNSEFIQQASVTDKHFKAALTTLGVRSRPQYNCRHTYATMCLMSGITPAFIANQLGHSVRMLLTTYARWVNSSIDWHELDKLENSQIGTKLVQTKTPLPANPHGA